jgi:hypothetical protein
MNGIPMNAATSAAHAGWTPPADGDIGDLALEVALLQIETLDGSIRERLDAMKQLNDVRRAYRERIAELNQFLHNGDPSAETVGVPMCREGSFDYRYDRTAGETGRGGVVEIGNDHPAPEGDPATGAYQLVAVATRRSVVEAEIDRLQARLDGLSSDGEIGMIQLNQTLSRRNQVIQLTSNVLASVHQSAMGIINNLRG